MIGQKYVSVGLNTSKKSTNMIDIRFNTKFGNRR